MLVNILPLVLVKGLKVSARNRGVCSSRRRLPGSRCDTPQGKPRGTEPSPVEFDGLRVLAGRALKQGHEFDAVLMESEAGSGIGPVSRLGKDDALENDDKDKDLVFDVFRGRIECQSASYVYIELGFKLQGPMDGPGH